MPFAKQSTRNPVPLYNKLLVERSQLANITVINVPIVQTYVAIAHPFVIDTVYFGALLIEMMLIGLHVDARDEMVGSYRYYSRRQSNFWYCRCN